MRCHLFGPFEWRIKGPGPGDRHMRVGLVRAPVIIVQCVHRQDGLDHRHIDDAVVGGVLVERAVNAAFGAGAVIAVDVDDQRVVELALVLDLLNHATNLVVGVGGVGGEDLGFPAIHLLFRRVQRVPFGQLGTTVLRLSVRPWRERCVRRNHAQLLLVFEELLAQLFPAHIELAVELVDPFLGWLVGRVRAAGHVIEEERLVRRGRVQVVHVLDGVVGQVGGEVVAFLTDPWVHRSRIAEQVGRPLVGFATQEAIEILKAHADRPLVEGASRGAVSEARGVVVFAEPRGGVAVLLQYLSDGSVILTDDGIIARVAGGQFANDAEADRVVVAAGDQGGPRRRAKRGGVELDVTQARLGDAVQVRRRDNAAEGAGYAVALVIGHDEQHVGRVLGRHDTGRPPGRRVLGGFLDYAAEFRGRFGYLLAIDRGGGVSLTQCARDLLRGGRYDDECGSKQKYPENIRDGKHSQRWLPNNR